MFVPMPATRSPAAAAAPAAHRNRNPRHDEKRRAHRVPCCVRALDAASGQISAAVGQTINISSGGLAIQVPRNIAPGTWVEAVLPYIHGDPIFVCGTVKHCRRVMADTYEIGIAVDSDMDASGW